MDMQAFAIEVGKLGLGGICNTYRQQGPNMWFVQIAERGDSGHFIKRECNDFNLNETLDMLLIEVNGGQWSK